MASLIENNEKLSSVRAKINQTITGLESANLQIDELQADQAVLQASAQIMRDTVAALLADTTLTYTTGQAGTVAAGNYIHTRAEQFSYRVAASGASDHQLTTAGGVKLYVEAVSGTVHARAFGAVGVEVAGSDDTAELQAFFNFAAANPGRYLYDWNGEWNISSTVSLSGDNNKYICGILYCIAPMSIGLTVNGVNANFTNHIRVYGNAKGVSVLNYTNRNVSTTLVDILWCGRSRFDGFIVEGSKRDGVRALTDNSDGGNLRNCISANLGRVEARNCGSAAFSEAATTYNISFAFTGRTDTGTSGSVAQRSVLTVPSIPTDLRENDVVRLNGEFYQVTAIDTVAGTISVYPWIFNLATTSGTLYSCHGSGLYIEGGNTTSMIIEGLNALRCGVGYYGATLYGVQLRAFIAQAGAIGVALSRQNIGGTIVGFHPEILEDSAVGFLVVGNVDIDQTIISGINVYRPNDIDMMVPLTSAGTKVYRASFLTLLDGIGGAVSRQTVPFSTSANANIGNSTASQFTANTVSNRPGINKYISNRTSGSLNVYLTYDEAYDRLFGYKTFELYQATTNATGGGMAVTFQPSPYDLAAGIKVMNSDTYSLPAARDARKVYAIYESTNKNWVIVSDINTNAVVSGSKTYDPPSIASLASTTTTVTVTGVAVGSVVRASFSLSLNGLVVSAYASATNTVTVVFFNPTGAAVDLGSGTLRVVSGGEATLSGSATYDPPSIAAGASTTTTVTVTGAALGDYAEASFSLSLGGLMMSAYVSAASTVTVVLFNPTAAAIDLTSGTLRATVQSA